ncbi:MAG TPA: metallophosphoesterase [Tepidisphaeraceae bacterium]|jgi:predicted phosphodiesterase
MRLIVTADLHYNHAKSKALADDLIDRINRTGGDVLLLVGDTAAFDGPALETCLERFSFKGPKLFVAGNHELWTHGDDSYDLFHHGLPRRVRDAGWHWLQTEPFVAGDVAVVGSLGWYDYSFAQPELGIPKRFYAAKVSPGAAEHVEEYSALLGDDVPPHAKDVIARWNDGKFVKLHRSDEEFLDELLGEMESQLGALKEMRHIIAAVHHLPFAQLLPPSRSAQWDFAKAYLGSARIGELLLRYPNVAQIFCGHSHFPIEATLGKIHAVNIGSGYRAKRFQALEI